MAKSPSITISDIERFQRAVVDGSAIEQQIVSGSCLSLAAASELDCVLQQAQLKSVGNTVDILLQTCPIWTLFRQMRESNAPCRLTAGSLALIRIPLIYDEEWLNTEIPQLEAQLLRGRFSRHLAKSLTGAVFEMVDNVWNHSQTAETAVLAYQVGSRSFTFSVTDLGLGVLDTLKRNRRYAHLKTSIEALEEAVKPNVSGKPDGSGLGLDQLTRSLANLWGRTRLRSGQGALTFDRETDVPKRRHQFLPQLSGFQISAICRLSPP